jgi:hypothetical protein
LAVLVPPIEKLVPPIFVIIRFQTSSADWAGVLAEAIVSPFTSTYDTTPSVPELTACRVVVSRRDFPVGTLFAAIAQVNRIPKVWPTVAAAGRLWQSTLEPKLFRLIAKVKKASTAKMRIDFFT